MKTGVIGLGAMGIGMALNLHKTGHLAAFWNRSPERSKPLSEQTGIAASNSPVDVAAQCDLIIICVSRDADVLEVVKAMLPNVKKGTVVIDTSTVSSDTAKQVAELLRPVGADFLDSPVSGGVEGAKNGTMAMMIGGDEAVLESVRSVLETIGGNIVYMGSTGSGQATKAVNQIMAAGINQAVTDALAFGESMGLDMEKVVDVVGSGAAANWFLDHRGKTMLKNEFSTGFKVALHHKDLSICHDMANAPLPSVEMTLKDYDQLIAGGYGEEDISSLFRIKREIQNKD
ncbi:MAG: NAD(P)-dependent oxidoreductase [Gammaproteobacteria bacterium]